MKRLLQLSILFITILLVASCGSDSGGPNPEITSVQPDSGPPGTSVTIKGKGFRPHGEMNLIFGGTSATLISATEDQIQTEVPESLSEGSAPVEVSVGGATASGPSFMVEAKAPGISSVEPDSGTVGTEVTIKGMNFSATASENVISFNGTQATVKSAAEDQLVTEVPQGASDGPIEVTVKQKSTISPPFDVITEGTLEVIITTSGSDKDSDGYMLTIDGSETFSTNIEDTIFVPDLEMGNHDAEITGLSENCSISSENPRISSISAGDTTSTTFGVSCEQVANNKIIFQSGRDGDSEVFLMNPDGSNVKQLTENTVMESYPRISSDGTKIAFYSKRNSTNSVYTMNVDGTNVKRIKNIENSTSISWSPDDSKITFSDYVDGKRNVYVMNIDGTGKKQLTDNAAKDIYPKWSPDGEKIAFASNRNNDGDFEIYIMNNDGSNLQKLTDNSSSDYSIEWSPDSKKLVFISDRDGDNEVYTMAVDGTDLVKVTDNSEIEYSADWSPDGSKLAVQRNQGSIYIVNSDGSGNGTNITPNNDAIGPNWSPIK